MPIQFLFILALLIATAVTWMRVRERVLRVREALFWTLVWVVAAVIILRPEVTSGLAHLVGVGRGVDLAVYASVTVLFFLVFKVFTNIDRLEKHLTDMVRKDALRDIENVRLEKKEEQE